MHLSRMLRTILPSWLLVSIVDFQVLPSLAFLREGQTLQRWETLSRLSSSLSESTTRMTPAEVSSEESRHILGSQELLMLPRQYGPNPKVTFPQMCHVSAAVLSETPSEENMKTAIASTMSAHPLLKCYVEGDGEPEKRIDLFQMVREGEPDPHAFVVGTGEKSLSVDDALDIVPVAESSGDASSGSSGGSGGSAGVRSVLDRSWKSSFERDLDDGSWCDTTKGPLWKVEWHRFSGDNSDKPCALVFAFNHAISDQSSANKITDQIIYHLAALEEQQSSPTPVIQAMPMALEDSVMGKNQRWSDVQTDGVSLGTLLYVAGKAAEGFRNPVILPDPSTEEEQEDSKSKILGALTTISGKAAGGEDSGIDERKSTVQYRTLPEDITKALLSKCRQNQVTVTNALTAAMALTATDFIDGGIPKEEKERNYKVLQSMDMRRFGEQLDRGKTVACMAGSMDLMHGPLPDRSGQLLRSNPTREQLDEFWSLAKSGKKQTEDFVRSGGPYQAVRVFDFAMTIADLNNLVHLTAQSKDSKGRAYSAGVVNVGVYERQEAFENKEDNHGTKLLQTHHGRFRVEDIHFATSHAKSGCLYQLSCLTVGGEMKLTFHPAAPIIIEKVNNQFADDFTELLKIVVSM